VYLDPVNLVIVLNSSEHEQMFYTKLLNSPLMRITSNNNGAEREKAYLSGGIQFISTQIFVLDLLKNKLPVELIS
jgi:DNA excision repair protein ERCC-4